MALLFAFFSYTIWSTGDAMVKLATEESVTPLEVMFFCGSLNALFTVLRAWKLNLLPELIPISKKLVFLRTLFGVLIGFFFYTSYSMIPLANSYVVEFTSPLIVSIGAALFLSERLSRIKLLIILLGFAGAYIAINPAEILSGNISAKGYAAVLAGTICFSASQLLLRKLSQSEKPEAMIFWAASATVAFSLFMTGGNINLPSPKAALFLLFASTCGLSGWFLMIRAFKNATATSIATLQYWQLVPGAIFGYLIWHTTPGWNIFIGSGIIIASGLAMAHQTHKQANVLALLEK